MANARKTIGTIFIIFFWLPLVLMPKNLLKMNEDQLFNIALLISFLIIAIGFFFLIISMPNTGPQPMGEIENLSADDWNRWKKDNPSPPPVYPSITKEKFIERVLQSEHEKRAINNEQEWHAHEARKNNNKKNNERRVQ